MHYTTHETYSFTSHQKDKAIMVKCLAQGQSAATGQAGIRTHILTTPELESNALDRSATTLHHHDQYQTSCELSPSDMMFFFKKMWKMCWKFTNLKNVTQCNNFLHLNAVFIGYLLESPQWNQKLKNGWSFHQVGQAFEIGVPCYVGKFTIYYHLLWLIINIIVTSYSRHRDWFHSNLKNNWECALILNGIEWYIYIRNTNTDSSENCKSTEMNMLIICEMNK